MRVGKKYITLLDNEDVKRWYENLARGSQSTADVRLRGMGRFCSRFKLTPKDLLLKSEKEISDLMMDYVSDLEKDGKAGSYIDSCLKPLKSWLRYNSIVLTRPIKIKNAKIPTTLKGQRTPSQEQLKKILQAGTMTSRVCIALVSQSGIRLEVLGDYMGRNGLKLGDFTDLKISSGEASFEKVPTRIVVRHSLSKAGQEFFTFIGSEGAEYIKDFLNDRFRRGENLDSDSPLIVPRNQDPHFICTINIGDQIRKAIRKAGYPWRPYDLRHYFATQMLEAESKETGMNRDYRVFMMGHKGDIESQYTLNNRTLSTEKIEDMRDAYARASKFLETEKKGMNEEDLVKKLMDDRLLTIELALGIKFIDKEKEELMAMTDEEFKNRIREISEKQRESMKQNSIKHKEISTRELASYLDRGYELVSFYPKGDRAIVRGHE
jgi:site-specific recombinase XerD